jgi:hypothetical protein
MLRTMLNRLTAGGTAGSRRRGRYGTRGRAGTGGTGAQIGAMVERFIRGRRSRRY